MFFQIFHGANKDLKVIYYQFHSVLVQDIAIVDVIVTDLDLISEVGESQSALSLFFANRRHSS